MSSTLRSVSLQLPEGVDPAVLAHLAGAGGAPPALPQGLQGGYDQDDSSDPLKVLQDCIQKLPEVLSALPDPQDVQDATQALLILTKVQTRLMNKQGGQGAAQAGQ